MVDVILNLIIDDTVEQATQKKAKKNIRYILFSALCGVLIIIFSLMIVHTFNAGNFAVSILLFVLTVIVAASWLRLRFLKKKK